ncbi:hypothetical protein F2Q69_00029082 [Brassica cretica]|uniref:Uncharacterized protein n=1 Tax=Brassica cretica TaxID=69181 RepID=A0A8S9RV89_BRACR|nr:hypothetical protein F2Q69_00029082 [Brassica cretica]
MLELGLSSPCLRARLIEHVIVRMIDEWIMMHKNTHTDKWDLMNWMLEEANAKMIDESVQISSPLSLVSRSGSRSRLRWSVLNPIFSHDPVYSFMLELGLSSPCLRARLIEHVIVRMIDEWIMMHKNTHTDKWDLMNWMLEEANAKMIDEY